MKLLLLPLSWLYGLIITCRNKAFDVGLLKSESVGKPVISVGNMTMGGTGKTPLVEYIVRFCLTKGRRVAVVSRGYKRETAGVLVVSDGKHLLAGSKEGGDEPVQIATKFPEAIVVVGERRVDAARIAVEHLKADAVILDDGFQHRYVHRDLDIVVLDSRKDLFCLPMIPAGERREPLHAIGRAHLLAFSRGDQVQEANPWVHRMSGEFRAPKIHYRYQLEKILQVGSDSQLSARDLKGMRVFLFSGIGDHTGFVNQMKRNGVNVSGDLRFPDHHQYADADVSEIARRTMKSGAEAILTTEKDVVRLSGESVLIGELVRDCPLFYANIVVDITEGRRILDSMIDKCLMGRVC